MGTLQAAGISEKLTQGPKKVGMVRQHMLSLLYQLQAKVSPYSFAKIQSGLLYKAHLRKMEDLLQREVQDSSK
jgi:hypothetical protein